MPNEACSKAEERACCPGLRRTGDRIERRPAPGEARKAAEQFRQAMQIEIGGGVEQSAEDA
jgi:hypothetical protein